MPCKDARDDLTVDGIREEEIRDSIESSLRQQVAQKQKRCDDLAAELCALRGNCVNYFDGLFGGGNDPEWMRMVRMTQAAHRSLDKQNAVTRAISVLANLKYEYRNLVNKWGTAPNQQRRIAEVTKQLEELQASDPMNTELY